jgi:predicted nuclease of predicted toxin-antitoxin system
MHVRDEGLQTLEDSAIFTKAVRESRIILIWDLDFTEILALSKTGIVSARRKRDWRKAGAAVIALSPATG